MLVPFDEDAHDLQVRGPGDAVPRGGHYLAARAAAAQHLPYHQQV